MISVTSSTYPESFSKFRANRRTVWPELTDTYSSEFDEKLCYKISVTVVSFEIIVVGKTN